MSKKEIPEEIDLSAERIVTVIIDAIPKVLSFIIVLGVGFLLLYPLEQHFQTWLSQYIPNKYLLTAITLGIAFGPLFYMEEKIEKFISYILAILLKRQLEEGKVKALEEFKKQQAASNTRVESVE